MHNLVLGVYVSYNIYLTNIIIIIIIIVGILPPLTIQGRFNSDIVDIQ